MFKPSSSRPLSMLIAFVLLVHWWVLRSVSLALDVPPSSGDTADSSLAAWSFTTRTLEPEPAAVVIAPPPPPPPPPPAPQKPAPTPPAPPIPPLADAPLPPAPEPQQEFQPKSAEAPVVSAQSAPESAAKPPPEKGTLVQRQYILPAPMVLEYEVDSHIGGSHRTGSGELSWTHDGNTYNARLGFSYFKIPIRSQTSTGKIGAKGLEPKRFGDKTRSEVAAHFEREKGKISFSANTPDAPLLEGAQDQLSVFIQMAALLAGNAESIIPGTSLKFQAAGTRSAEDWTFAVGDMDHLTLPGGEINARHLWRDANAQYDVKVDIWLAPDLGYLPVRIRLTQTNGDVIEQQWRATEKP